MAALTRGRAILQDNRTLILGNSFTVKTNQAISLKKPQNPIHSAALEYASQPRTLTTLTNNILYAPTNALSTRIVSSQSFGFPLQQRFFSDEQKVLLPENVDLSKITIGQPIKTGTAKIIPIYYGGEKKVLRIQTPVMRAPFGLAKSPMDQDKPSAAFIFQLAFDKKEANADMLGLYNLLKEIDQKIIDAAHANPVAWFNKENIPAEVIKHNFKSSVREPPPNTTYAPTLKTKVPSYADPVAGTSGPRIAVFKDRKKLDTYELRGSKVVSIIELKHAWIAGGASLGITWNTLQVKVVEESQQSGDSGLGDSYSFVDKK